MRAGIHALLGAALVWTSLNAQQPPPTFQREARVVTVNASVELKRRPVPGLTSGDFVLLDNGVQQTVSEAAYETVPVDVTVIVDLSQSNVGALNALERDAHRIASFLRPTERLRVLAIDTYVHEVVPLNPVGALTVRPLTAIAGWSAVHDAISAALLVPSELDRRKLVVAFTDGLDNASRTSPEQLVTMARASDSVLVVVHMRPRADGPSMSKVPSLTWTPSLEAVEEAARVTGGEVLRENVFGSNRLAAVERILSMFRQSYVLRYVPTGVERAGWHKVELRVKGQPEAAIRARRAYFGG